MPTIWSDAPITSAGEDAFGRSPYATQIARLIQDAHSWKDSIVFGLLGPWGSGKSSMLAMIEEQLTSNGRKWHIARFTPWATSDVNGLLGDFYAALSDALPPRNAERLRQLLGTILQISAPVAKMIPWAGEAVSGAAEKAGDALQNQPSWSKAFQEASDELKHLNTPVLVIADDIDRLHGPELLALLKVVRLLGRFPGVHFLLAYDEQTVTETLAETGIAGKGNAAGRKFMEKIVQYPLTIPPLLPTQLLFRLEEGLAPFINDLEQPDMFRMRLQGLRKVLLSQLSTPRAIDRYIAQVRHHLVMFDPQEVQGEDVMVMTLLKTSFPSVYNRLPRYKDQLITGMQDERGRGFFDDQRESFNIDPLFDGIIPDDQSDARILVEELFPKVRQKNSYYFSRVVGKSIYDKHYFDRYFAMGVPAHDVPDTEVAKAVVAAAGGADEHLKELLLEQDHQRVLLVLEKVETSTDLLEENDERLAVLRAVIPLLGAVENADATLNSVNRRLKEWAGKLLSQINDYADPASIYKALEASPTPLDQIHLTQFMLLNNGNHSWTAPVLEHICRYLSEIIMGNLRVKDAASHDEEVEFMIFVLREWQQDDILVEPISAGLAKGDFSVEDVAARFVSCAQSSRGEETLKKLHDFNKEAFEQIVPEAGTSWHGTPGNTVDEYDLSWSNRRLFASSIASRAENSRPE